MLTETGAVNRTYPSNSEQQLNVAATLNGIDKGSLVRGVHLGHEQPKGVALPGDPSFADMLPIHRVDRPTDGWNDGANFVVYFQKEVDGNLKFYKAINANPATITELTSGPEYTIAVEHKQV
jgi:hypothetical protein